MLFSSSGKAIRFSEDNVRAMGRTARGVRGIKLAEDQKVISLIVPKEGGQILTASVNGFGKKTELEEFSRIGRGGQGVIAMQCSERNGELVSAIQVFEGDEMMLISDQGTLVRTRCDEVSTTGRNTQGVKLISLKDGEHLVRVSRVAEEDVASDETEEASEEAAAEATATPPSETE